MKKGSRGVDVTWSGFWTLAAASATVYAANLPLPCSAGSCGPGGPQTWVTAGNATATQVGGTLTVNQTTNNALLNWQSFNISSDGTVNFVQPSASALAVNRIFQADPSQIFGALNANGRIYLINQNGILFGAGAQVNVSGLVASTLDITPDALKNGIAGLHPGAPDPAFTAAVSQDGTPLSKGIAVESGARISAPGGQIFLLAPLIDNRGTLSSPDGQTILAAANTVLLATSTDPNIRGLVVAIDTGGTVNNGTAANQAVSDPTHLVGQIFAERGNVTLMGLAVNQLGRVSATTSVRANGTIKLVASDTLTAGSVTLGTMSRTEVGLDSSDTSKTVDANSPAKSGIDIIGGKVTLASDSSVVAPSGTVTVVASRANTSLSTQNPAASVSSSNADTSRLYVGAGATIDVSGATAILPMEDNVLQVQLRGSELANQPVQRNGVLRGKTVNVDIRQKGTLADGTAWQGTPLADLRGDIATIQRGVSERNLSGGTVSLRSQGDVIVAPTAQVNVSGGAIHFLDGYVNASTVIGADGQLYDIANATADRLYAGVANTTSMSVLDQRWGVTKEFTGIFGTTRGHFEAGYVQGADAGSLSLNAPHVIFDGSLNAKVMSGPYQRQPAIALAAGTLLRPFDQLALPGGLTLGAAVDPTSALKAEAIVPAITFASAPVLPSLTNPNGTRFDALTDPWPASVDEVRINPVLVGPGAAGRVVLSANRSITIPSSLNLQLPAGGSFRALAGMIDIGGSISGNGAAVDLQTVPTISTDFGKGGIRLQSTASINVSGAWVNDNPAVTSGPPIAPLLTSGGKVNLNARDGDLTLAPGAVIDVSGGAHLLSAGSLEAADAGSVSVTAGAADQTPTRLWLGATFRAYGIRRGGSLSLAAGSVCIHGKAACSSTPASGGINLDPAFFSTGGFANFSLSSNFGAFELAPQTQVHPIPQNFLSTADLARQVSAPTLVGIASVGKLDDAHRSPVNLSFSSHFGRQGDTVTANDFATAPDLVLGTSSAIVLEPLASLSLLSDTRILDDGLISAPSGKVSMTVSNTIFEDSYIAGHKIWLGDHATLDLHGALRATYDDLGHSFGDILPGGTVSLTAQRGAVETMPGSRIDVSGTAGTLDVPQVRLTGPTTYQSLPVASAGGNVAVVAAEAVLLSGQLAAHSGDSARLAGGTFSLQLDAELRYGNTTKTDVLPSYPYSARRIEISPSLAPIALGPRTDLPDAYEARALLSADMFQKAGFDAVSLQAATLDRDSSAAPLPGALLFTGDVSVSVGRRLSLDAASFLSDGGRAALSAPYVALGQTRAKSQNSTGTAIAGTGTLAIDAGFIDLIGHTALGNLKESSFRSTGDIRLIGVQDPLALATPSGALTTSGTLALDAQQIYPSTLTSFDFTAGSAGSGLIDIRNSAGSASSPLMSAGGQLTLHASQITQGGVLRAPFGSIILAADKITLAPASITSTGANGQTIPFGQTQGGFDWAYPLNNGTLVYGTHGRSVPKQSIQLSGVSVDIDRGAVVNASGGGDLLATEFVNGPTGTQDVLAATNPSHSGAFAILPTSSLQYAPYDPYYWSGSSIRPGDSVHLSGGGGVAAGNYAVLPARYALLPGAYFVTPVSGYQDLAPGQQIEQADGSAILSGYRLFAGSNIGDARASGFQVTAGAAVLNLAKYTGTSANTFFLNQAGVAGVAAPKLPRDAGTVALSARSDLILNGSLVASAGAGGRGGAVDITSAAIRVVDGSEPRSSNQNTLDIDANALSALGAESILIGGVRSGATDGLQVSTQANSVEVSAGAKLSAPELLIAATNQVSVDQGAVVLASGLLPASDPKILLQRDGALLRVAAGGDPLVVRSDGSGMQGQLLIAAGARVVTPGGSVSIESSRSATLAGTLELAGGALSITGKQISLGNAPATTVGTVLPSAVLSALSVNNLTLSSRGSIDLYNGANLSGTNLVLSASGLRGFTSANTQITASDRLTLAGSSPLPAAGGTGGGNLRLQGANINLKAGSLDISGFSSTALVTPGVAKIFGSGKLNFSGDLAMQAGLLTAESGAQRDIRVGGNFSYGTTPGAAAIVAPTEEALGGSLGITAQTVNFDGAARLRSGLLSLTATTSSVTLGSHSAIDLSGVTTTFDSVGVNSRGGSLAVESRLGNITAAAGSQINVSALDDRLEDAGRISLLAPKGNIALSGQLLGRSADFSADGQSLGSVGALNTLLGSGGFSGKRSLRLRGAGPLIVGTGSAESITARSVALQADQGSVIVNGTILSHGPMGGVVTLSARDDVVVNGMIDARPTTTGEQNGHVELRATNGGVRIQSGATLAAYDPSVPTQSNAEGALLIRAPREVVLGTAGAGLQLAGDLQQLKSVTIEALRTYQMDTIGAADTPVLLSDASNFMATAPTLVVRGPTPQIIPGLQIDAKSGSLTLASDWSLDSWRFGNAAVPGILTLRASGDLRFNRSLSDGFTGTTGTAAYTLSAKDASWSYRLVAGADFSASDPLAVRPLFATPADGTGSIIVAAGTLGVGTRSPAMTMIRTGTGSIDLAAARDVVLTNTASMIYTAGIASDGITYTFGRPGQLQGRLYPTKGGNINISAGQDVLGAPGNNQLVTDWLWRVGSPGSRTATAWTVNFARFAQDIGALGGGNVSVSAGRDLVDLSVNVPTIGRQVGGARIDANRVDIIGGGNIFLQAGRDVAGGSIYAGRGSAVMVAGNQVKDSPGSVGLFPVIALGDANAALSARAGITLAGAVNPTMLPQGASQSAARGSNFSFFSTYGDNSALTLRTLAGNGELVNDTTPNGALRSNYTSLPFFGGSASDEGGSSALRIYPGSVNVAALRGDITVDNTMTLFPAPHGGIGLLAHDSVRLGTGNQFELIESDADRSLLPTVNAPQSTYFAASNLLSSIHDADSDWLQSLHAPVPVHLASPVPDTDPSRIVALTRDVSLDSAGTSLLSLAKPLHIVAGRDVLQLGAEFQNLRPTDVSAIVAGRDITYQQQRDVNGVFSNLSSIRHIAIDGPGTLDVWAGRDLNLQTAAGITSQGNRTNPALPADGASIDIETGIGGSGMRDFSPFISQYLANSSNYAGALSSYMQPRLGGFVSADQALRGFKALSPLEQAPLLETIFFAELRASGRSAAKPGPHNNDFTRGFAAIQAMFPGGNPDPAKGEINPYGGDLSLYFSRIYTVAGGDIRLLAPGGQINAGLASPPTSFGVSKAPSELGIVAQSSGSVLGYSFGDFAVNESRVFAADGGDILMWATRGNIDAGRGAKTAISTPPPTVVFDNGVPRVVFPASLTGSGIQTLATSKGVSPGNVDLFAPHGVVNASDAGIVAGNLTIAATAVLGADNIKVSGISVGVPVDTGGLGAGLAAVSSVASSASQAATQGVEATSKRNTPAPVAEAALRWLDVFVEGFGEEVCKASDLECLKRQNSH